MKQKNIPIILLLFTLTACFAIWNNLSNVEITSIYSEDGVWDLCEFNFASGNASLKGAVEYIPNVLLSPEEFAAREDEAQIGSPEDISQYATSRIRVFLPDNGYYTFSVRSIDFCHRLFINGEWFWDIGTPGESRETTVPDTSRMTFIVQAKDGVVEIVQQAANFVHREGGGHAGWHVGLPGTAKTEIRSDLSNAIIVGCYLALFFIHIMLHLLLRRYRANLSFSLLCLMWILRSGVTGPTIFSSLFPRLSWIVKFRIEYLAFPATAALLLSLLDTLYPRVLPEKFLHLLYAVSALWVGLFLFADTLLMSYALPVSEIIYIPAILYIAYCFTVKLRHPNLEQSVFLAGVGLVFFSFAWDMFYYNNIISFRLLNSEWSMLIFAFFAAGAVFIATMREVEEAKAQEQRLAAENVALDRVNLLRGSLMATLSHEMRTPLTVMSVYAQLAVETLRESGVDEQTTSDLAMISDEAKRLAEMASGFLDLTREQESTQGRGSVDLGAVIAQMARLCAPMLVKNENRLELDVPQELPSVCGNAGECGQILWNLVDNAARHTRDGVITIKARYIIDNPGIIVSVSDTGTGIDPELLPHIFRRHVSGSEERSGLGLAICKEIIDAHGGTIEIESTVGQGTTVTFTLPKQGTDSDRPGQKSGEPKLSAPIA